MAECGRGESGRRFASNRRPAAIRNCCHSCRVPASPAIRCFPGSRADWARRHLRDARFRLRLPSALQDCRGDDRAYRREQKSAVLSDPCLVSLREARARRKGRSNIASRPNRSTVHACVFQQLRAFPGSRAGNTGDGLLRADADPAPRISNHSFRQGLNRHRANRHRQNGGLRAANHDLARQARHLSLSRARADT